MIRRAPGAYAPDRKIRDEAVMTSEPFGADGQFPFIFPAVARFSRADFVVAPANAAALGVIERWPDWPDRAMRLLGPPGSGKSHLLAIWAARAGAMRIDPAELPEITSLAAAAPRALALDDADRVTDETRLFHLLNYVFENRLFLLMTARDAPGPETIRLPDLLSRLRRAPAIAIGAPDEALVRAVLEKLFRDRQIAVDPPALAYAALRLDRSLEAVRACVDALDREALARGRPVTRALAAEVMEKLRRGDEDAGN
jgi:chromosomal replication initiation ATPase DnaA